MLGHKFKKQRNFERKIKDEYYRYYDLMKKYDSGALAKATMDLDGKTNYNIGKKTSEEVKKIINEIDEKVKNNPTRKTFCYENPAFFRDYGGIFDNFIYVLIAISELKKMGFKGFALYNDQDKAKKDFKHSKFFGLVPIPRVVYNNIGFHVTTYSSKTYSFDVDKYLNQLY